MTVTANAAGTRDLPPMCAVAEYQVSDSGVPPVRHLKFADTGITQTEGL